MVNKEENDELIASLPSGGQGIPPFPGTICASVNEVICHGIPSNKLRLQEGDIIGVDIGDQLLKSPATRTRLAVSNLAEKITSWPICLTP